MHKLAKFGINEYLILRAKNCMEQKPLTLEELKPFLPAWLWELKKKAKEEKESRELAAKS